MNPQFITYLELHIFELKCNFLTFFTTFLSLFLICFYFSNQIIYILIKNLIKLNLLKYFIFTNITEIFSTNIKIALFISLFITIQTCFFQIWYFIAPGLYQNENYKIVYFYIFYIFLNFLILFFILIKIIPNIWYFFININFKNNYIFNIYFEPNFNNYFYFFYKSFIYIYLIFIYIYIFFFILINNFFKINLILNLRKFFYLKFLFISILISPPDIINQFILFLFFIISFELVIYIYIYLTRYFFNKI
jgi:sec-independent protein translocase protein TatC